MDNDPPKPPAPLSLRLTLDAAAALDALTAATGGKVPRHRLAVAALTHGARALAADRAALVSLLAFGLEPPPPHAASPAAPPSPPPAVAPPSVVHPSDAGSAGVMRPSAGVVQSSAAVVQLATPATHPRVAATGRARPGARGDASGAEVDAMLSSLRGAMGRGASINAIAAAAGMTGGGTRGRLAALLAGERPPVSVQLARAVTAAAEKHGR